MTNIKVSAPGKLHLLGEHAVVYDKPAIITAVDKRCLVETIPRSDNKIKTISKNYNADVVVDFAEVIKKFEKSQKDWELYSETNDISLLKSITKEPLDYPVIIIGQFLNYFNLKSINGFDLIIDSQIPVGAGMGSSGALAVSIIGALFLFVGKPFDKEDINKIAFLAEQKKHGKPSGGDNTTSCFGGLIWFKKSEGLKTLDTNLPKKVVNNFYVINTGTPSETTGEMVSRVRALRENDQEFVDKILDDQERLVHALLPALKASSNDQIIEIIRSGEVNLEKLGVASKYAQKIIREIEENGGAAKICGAGGVTRSTGIILIYHEDQKKLQEVSRKNGFEYERLSLGAPGLREESNE